MIDVGKHNHAENYEVIAHQRTGTGDVETIYWCKLCGAYQVRQVYKDDDGEHNCISDWIVPKQYKDVVAARAQV